MAKKGTLTIQGGIQLANAYVRLGGISGGKQSGYWQADLQVYSDGGAAAQAHAQARAAWLALPGDGRPEEPSAAALDAVRVHAGLPLAGAAWEADASPYTLLYAAVSAAYPNLIDA